MKIVAILMMLFALAPPGCKGDEVPKPKTGTAFVPGLGMPALPQRT